MSSNLSNVVILRYIFELWRHVQNFLTPFSFILPFSIWLQHAQAEEDSDGEERV